MFTTNPTKAAQAEIDRLTKEEADVAAARAKLNGERLKLEADLLKTPLGDEAALTKLLERKRSLGERDDLLKQRGELTAGALKTAQATLAEAQAQARRAEAETVRAQLRQAEKAALEATVAAEKAVGEKIEAVRELATRLGELERERPDSNWAYIDPDHPLPGASDALAREDMRGFLRSA